MTGRRAPRATLACGWRTTARARRAPFYGWAFVTLNAAGSSEFTVNGFAYDTVAGEAIQAGAVPEPNSVLLLIAGAAGVTALRARRKQQTAVLAE